MELADSELAELRELLIARREALRATAATNDAATAVVELDQARIGRLSRMDAMQSQAMSVEIKRRNDRELVAIKAALARMDDEDYGEVAIKAALARMDDEDYGECLHCGEAIAMARLRANPVATLCIECAERGGR